MIGIPIVDSASLRVLCSSFTHSGSLFVVRRGDHAMTVKIKNQKDITKKHLIKRRKRNANSEIEIQ